MLLFFPFPLLHKYFIPLCTRVVQMYQTYEKANQIPLIWFLVFYLSKKPFSTVNKKREPCFLNMRFLNSHMIGRGECGVLDLFKTYCINPALAMQVSAAIFTNEDELFALFVSSGA